MVKKKHKFICLLLSLSLILCSFGCSKTQTDECPYEEFLVIDVFDTLANYQGIQSGWFAKIVKDKFNMELNIISRNVSGGGDTLFDTRAAAENLGIRTDNAGFQSGQSHNHLKRRTGRICSCQRAVKQWLIFIV